MFTVLDDLIILIHEEFQKCSDEWIQNYDCFNTKNKQIRHLNDDPNLVRIISSFQDLMNEKSIFLMLLVSPMSGDGENFPNITLRAKTWESINFKIETYMNKEGVYGKVSVEKSFNDLLGIRIILPIKFEHEQLLEHISTRFPHYKLKVTNATKNGYIASHIYFMPDNKKMFPWELQVWYIGDKDNNIASHKQYKQGYTNWQKEFKKGGV